MFAAFEKDIVECLRILKKGGTILYPTDTVWGIGCDATNAKAVQKLYKIKQRNDNKSMIILITDDRQIINYVAAPDLAVFDFLEKQTRPTTIIFEDGIGLPQELTPDGTIGLRIVKDKFCRHLIKRLQKPVVSTSANISGQPAPSIFPEISEEIKKQVDHIVQWRQDDTEVVQPSQIIKWNKNGDYTVIRS
jgi:L-threonylcarbamoyladenylate synthase